MAGPNTFDSALPRFVSVVNEHLGSDALAEGVFIRDASGRLRFVMNRTALPTRERQTLEKAIAEALGPYVRADGALAFNDDPGAYQYLKDSSRVPIIAGDLVYQLIDRRIVGSAWTDTPVSEMAQPPRIVFASIKGGVGRSTALTIVAADLARRNKNVLVIDLDLEAPGLGNLLLDDARRPKFGTADFLVENGIGGVTRGDLDQYVGVSELTTAGGGRVDIVPAFGSTAREHPENVLGKLSRAMIEDVDSDGTATSVAAQIRSMVDRLVERASYDVVLIDSRAGLAELAAPVLLGLGANVLLFGTAQKHTMEGYRALFASLKLLAQRDRTAGLPADWRAAFKAVHAKAAFDPDIMDRHRDELFELFAEFLYDIEEPANPTSAAFTYAIDDFEAPHWPLVIPFNPSFVNFDAERNTNQLTQPFYEQAFRNFLDGIDMLIATTGSERA